MEQKKSPELLKNINSINIEINQMAHAVIGREWTAEHVCSVYTRVYMIIDGYGYISCKSEKIKMVPGNIYIVPAGLDFSYYCDSCLIKLYFHFNAYLPGNFDLFSNLQKFVVIENKGDCIKEIERSLSSLTISSVMKIKSCIYDIADYCIQKNPQLIGGAITGYSHIIENSIDYISKNLSARLEVSEIADAMFISVSRLQKLFRKETGIPIRKYINDRLMLAAESEIRKGELSIKEISDLLGFCDQFYFSRCFTQKFGRSPLKYKKLCNM